MTHEPVDKVYASFLFYRGLPRSDNSGAFYNRDGDTWLAGDSRSRNQYVGGEDGRRKANGQSKDPVEESCQAALDFDRAAAACTAVDRCWLY
ncbi:MAG: hypothetical protein NVS2B12_03530 [Ktedonobacteraceae bacterium]